MPKLTIPTKNNLHEERGSIVLTVSDFEEESSMHLLTIGNIQIYLTANVEKNELNLNNMEEVLGSIEFEKEEIDIVLSWERDSVWLSLYSKDLLPEVLGVIEPLERKPVFNEVLSLFEDKYFNGVYQKISIYSQPFDRGDIGPFNLEVFEESTEQLFHADFTQATHYDRSVILEDTFAPRNGSPILVSDDEGLMERHFFFDEKTGSYSDSVTEEFIYLRQPYERISYKNVELDYKPLIEAYGDDGLDFLYYGEDFYINDGQIIFNLSNEFQDYYFGCEFKIVYQISRSYNIEFNEDVPHDGYRINLTNLKVSKDGELYNSTENIRVLKEGNRFEDEYLAKEIELNPLVNPQVQGFMYIDTSEQFTQAFRIRTSSQYLNGNGVDSASIMIEAIDEEGNEVLSPYLSVVVMNDKGDITSGFGDIEPVIGRQSAKARNTSGRAYYQFNAPVLTSDVRMTHKVYIVALDRKTGIGAQYPIFIQSVRENQVIPNNRQSMAEAEIPFEYFARYFEREIPNGHPIGKLDNNKNQLLDTHDLELFKESLEEINFSELTKELLDWEKVVFKQ